MKIRLHEIEFGVSDPGKSKLFYESVLGLETSLVQDELKVFKSGTDRLDFNISTHLTSGKVVTSFLTDNLQEVIEQLKGKGIEFNGPMSSHLGMLTIEFEDGDGHLLRVNQPTEQSPSWLKV